MQRCMPLHALQADLHGLVSLPLSDIFVLARARRLHRHPRIIRCSRLFLRLRSSTNIHTRRTLLAAEEQTDNSKSDPQPC